MTDNTADTLTLDRPWRVLPDATSQYGVGQFFAENHWYGNQNNTPGRTSLWYEQIGNVISHQRDVFAGGLDIWGSDLTDCTKSADPKADWETRAGFHPSWFNVIEDSWFDGSRVHLWSSARPTNLLQGPPIFGTLIVRDKVRQPHATRTTFAWNFHTDGGILVGNRSGRDGYIPADPNAPAKPDTRRVAVSHTLVTDNQVSYTGRATGLVKPAHNARP